MTARVAVVTGSTRGIGRGIAEHFLAEGYRVVVNGRHQAQCSAMASVFGPQATGIAADVTTEDGVRSLFAQVEQRFGRVDVLVNNAGAALIREALETSVADWDHVMGVDLTAVFLCSREAGRMMLAGAGGVIVNVSSIQASGGMPGRVAYSSAKAGVEALTRVLAAEWAPTVRVNAIVSGYVKTELVVALMEQGRVSEEEITSCTPLGRLGEPADIAHAAAFLSSSEASFITGSILTVDGGWLVQRNRHE